MNYKILPGKISTVLYNTFKDDSQLSIFHAIVLLLILLLLLK